MLSGFLADLYTPLGITAWVLYLIPLSLSMLTWRPYVPLLIAASAAVFITITFLVAEPNIYTGFALWNRGFGSITILVVATVAYLFIKNKIAVRHWQWLQTGRSGLSDVMAGEQGPEQFGDNVLKFLAELLDAHAGALFIRNEDRFRRIATYGVPLGSKVPQEFSLSDGLLGQAAKDRGILLVPDVPDGYLWLGSALGQAKPRNLVIAPMQVDNSVNAVLELGFLQPIGRPVTELLEDISEQLGVAIRSGNYRLHLQNLLEETQRQAEELQVQGEELRVANEELEERSRALQESQSRLEQQQEELEQSNSQLEEQTQLLESQRDELARARSAMELKARELERASQYKSDFLANMSHELRTPLNSTLILARLLAENPQGNLSDEQITAAKTILSSGNDLLELINDILDLSKIEAGRMEMRPQTVWLEQLGQDLDNSLRPLAEQKGLRFHTHFASECPESIYTDRQRLEQILRNLLTNAIKFTEEGEVTLSVSCDSDDRVSFEVTDTGIGISEEQQQHIFDAFRQIDSAANRKYSGTGLGLSISRELSRLLGGEIHLTSEPDRGSQFTVTLPRTFDPALVRALPEPSVASSQAAPVSPAARRATTQAPAEERANAPSELSRESVKDDRGQLQSDRRVLLVVEDDEPFARILRDLAKELGFQCLLASSCEEALTIADEYLPSAVVLDVGLPDNTGLTVLDRLKHSVRTRHIPVHVVSASDYSEAALTMGAVGYLIKPVSREKLIEALKGLETRLDQKMRRVLIVEDDEVQLESLHKLLRSQDVETLGVRTASECLKKLKEATFDCMVLDIVLPDASGFSILETLSQEDAYAFPPVIVYTSRDLSQDEEQQLRRYSKSIIIKGAKSPERLLDEVTLFLHQVVAELPPDHQKMIQQARSREAALEGRCILVVEDDVRNVYALTSILEPRGVVLKIARNGREALEVLESTLTESGEGIDLVLMDVMMPEMDGLSATEEIRKRPEWKKLPIIMLTAKAMKDDQEKCIAAGANDYMAKPLDVDKLLSLVRVWIRR